MARTIEQIYNDLVASKESKTELNTMLPNPETWSSLYTYENFKLLANNVLNKLSQSKVAIWRLIMYVVAYASWIQENLYDAFKTEVTTLITNREYGQLPWYVTKAKEFQYGDSLEWINESYFGYQTIDETKRIVTQAAATVNNGIVILKLAKGDIGSLEKLSTTELAAINSYFLGSGSASVLDGIAPAGTKMSIISDDPDYLKMSINIYYDPLILDESGVLIEDGISTPVHDAITNYIQQLPFDGKLKLMDLVDAIQEVEGIDNVAVKYCDARYGSVTWIDLTATESESYVSYSGYFEMNTDNGLDGYYDHPTDLIKTLNFIEK